MKSSPSNLSLTTKSAATLLSILFLSVIGTISFVSATDLKTAPPVVTVNGKKMEQAELDRQVNRILNSAKGRIPADQIDKFKDNMQGRLISDFITRTLIKEECDKLKIEVTKKELDDKLNESMKRLPKEMDLDAALKQNGLNREEFNNSLRFSIQIEKLVALKTKDQPAPTESEIKKYFETNSKKFNLPAQVNARHILIKTDSNDNETIKKEKKDRIISLREKLLQGSDFAELAKENSDCPSGKARGGDLGTFPRGRMVKAFEDAAFSQKINEIGPVIETRFGFHIIQVTKIIEAKTKTLEESRDTIIKAINQKQNQKITRDLITKLNENAKIDYADAYKPAVK